MDTMDMIEGTAALTPREYVRMLACAAVLPLERGPFLALRALLRFTFEGNDAPSLDEIAAECHSCPRSVLRWVNDLAELGIVERRRRGQGLTNVYRVPALAEMERLAGRALPAAC